jgi:hypothetical protein
LPNAIQAAKTEKRLVKKRRRPLTRRGGPIHVTPAELSVRHLFDSCRAVDASTQNPTREIAGS